MTGPREDPPDDDDGDYINDRVHDLMIENPDLTEDEAEEQAMDELKARKQELEVDWDEEYER